MDLKHAMTALLLALPLAAHSATFRYAREANVIYVQNGGSATLSAIKAAIPDAPLQLVDRAGGIWLLGADLVITNGGALRLHGSAIGGDVNELRLKSNNSPARGSFVSLTADHGFLDIRSTRVTSWDTERNVPDTEHEHFGRAFIRARSRLRAMVLIPLQSRMDIVDSEIAYLGYGANESYGLVWKVVAPEPYVFDEVRVYGNILNSKIHDNYFGVYTSGAKSSEWRHNEIHHNVQYGFAPHNRSDDLRIEDNDVHHNGHHGITVRQRCARAVIRNNRTWANGESGINLHRHSNDGAIIGNRAYRNRDAGISVYASERAVVRDNVVRQNGHVGIQLAMGTADSQVEGNEVGDNGFYGLFVGRGKGRPEPGTDGQPRRNHIAGNLLYGSGAEDLRTGDTALNRYVDNTLLAGDFDAALTAEDDAALFMNPPRGEVAAFVADDAGGTRVQATASTAVAQAPRARVSSFRSRATLWQIPEKLLWVGAAGLILVLVLMYGVGSTVPRR